MNQVERARRLCRELGGPQIDLWSLPTRAVERAEATRRPLPEVVQDFVSGWLAVRAREGDDEARERLVRLWRREVVRWCRWNGSRGVEAEDAAHDVLVRALQRLDRLTRPEGFRPWLWAIAWRVLREYERRPWRTRWLLGDTGDEHTSPAPSVPETIEGAERLEQIRQVLKGMNLEDRTLLWHAYVDGRTRAQIAELTGWAEGTLNRRLTRARKRFRTEAERRGLQPLGTQNRVNG